MFVQCEPDWGLGDSAVVVHCQSEREARRRVEEEYEKWASLAAVFRRRFALLKYPRCKGEGFPIIASLPQEPKSTEYDGVLTMPALIGELPLTRATRRALDTILDQPEEKWFLHRVSPDFNSMVQIAVSEAAASLIVGATVKQAVGRRRSDYMPASELARMQKEFRQRLSADGTSIELDFALFSPVTGSDWRRVWYNYSIVGELPTGELLQLGRCDGVEAIAPVLR